MEIKASILLYLFGSADKGHERSAISVEVGQMESKLISNYSN